VTAGGRQPAKKATIRRLTLESRAMRRARLDLAILAALALLTNFAYFACSNGDFFFPDSKTYIQPAQSMLACFVFALRYAVSVPALVLENVTAREAIRRSVSLTRGSLGRAAVLAIFATIIAYAAVFLLQGPFAIGVVMAGPGTSAAMWFSLIGAIAGTIGNAITGPIMIVALAVFYYDVRIRKEGLDLQLMVANLDRPAMTPAPAV
jgi:hypothetical protein